jgi:hypothetical protein
MSNPPFLVAGALSDCNAKGSDVETVPLPFLRILGTKILLRDPSVSSILEETRMTWLITLCCS